MLLDLMATQAEHASSSKDPGPWEEYQEWLRTLATPPVFTLADRDTVERLMLAKLRVEFAAAVAAEQWDVGAARGEEDGAPSGWDSDTLLAEMAASARAG